MNKLINISIAIMLGFIVLTGCDQLKSEDERIKDVLIGKYYKDDEVDDNGTKIKDLKGEFFPDGKFITQATFEVVDDETFETTDIKMKIGGEWKIKDKFIYYTYDFDRLEIIPEFWMLMKDEMVKSIKDKNSPDKVIDFDAAKIIFEDSDGERSTLKKSY